MNTTFEETIYNFSEQLERAAKRTANGKVKKALIHAVKALIEASTAIVTEEENELKRNPPKTLDQAFPESWQA